MNQRTLLNRLLSPAGFGLVLIAFLLPFVTVSCGEGREHVDATLSGVDLALGSMPEVSSPDNDPETAEAMAELWVSASDLEPLALLAACAVIAGMIVGVVRQRRLRFGSAAILAVLAIGLLAGALARVPSQARAFLASVGGDDGLPDAPPTISLQWGTWVVLVLLLGLVVGNTIAFFGARGDEPEPDPVPVEEPGRLSLDELT